MKVTVFGTILDDDGMCKLVKNKVIDYAGEENLDEPTKVYRLLRDVFQMDKQTEEYLYMLCMSGASRLEEVPHPQVKVRVLPRVQGHKGHVDVLALQKL